MNVDEIRERYQRALDAKPSKGDYTPAGIDALTDSVCDIPELLDQNRRYANQIANTSHALQAALDEYVTPRFQQLEALAEWHETKAEKARRFPGVGDEAVMRKAADVHIDAARRIRAALRGPEEV